MPDEIRPLSDLIVGDRYWLGRAQTMIESGVTARDAAAGRLMTAIAWFWTAYTAAALVTSSLPGRDFTTTTAVLVALPAVLLIIAYLLSLWATLPISFSFDPRIPHDVEAAHNAVVRRKRSRLAAASGATVVAALAVASTLIVTATARNTVRQSLDAIITGDGQSRVAVITGTFPGAHDVLLQLTSPGLAPIRFLRQTTSAGSLDISVPVQGGTRYVVNAKWTANGVQFTMKRTIESAGNLSR